MRYFYRLLVTPSLWALASYLLLFGVLQLELPGYDRYWFMFAVLAIPFIAAFHLQLQQIDLIDQIIKLKQQVERQQSRLFPEDET